MALDVGMGNDVHMAPGGEAQESHGRGHIGNDVGCATDSRVEQGLEVARVSSP